MALETLKNVQEINGHQIRRRDYLQAVDSYLEHIEIVESLNRISFKIQDGPIKEVGVNGCQIDEMIQACLLIVEGLDSKYPSPYNKDAIEGLKAAKFALQQRKIDREKRGVEGVSAS